MPNAIEGLEPAAVWRYFAELSRIPRASKNEKAAGDFVIRVARQLGLEHRRDDAGNVRLTLPASPGLESAPWLCLQGHLDMVCVARPGVRHDFARDPITLVRRDGVIAADGTTLGGDNGIAVAMNLAVAADRALEHGPLELLFTVDEETGLTGARDIAPDLVQSRLLINLDSDDEGVLTVGCAGGADTMGTWELRWDRAPAGAALELRVTGLRGGHSGVEIHEGRGNAIQLLNRVVRTLEPLGARVARLEGGSKRNAIPAEARAIVVVPQKRLDEARRAVAEMRETLRDELGPVEPGLQATVAPAKRPARVLARALQARIGRAISGLPNGVLKMSPRIPGLVETSSNVAVLATTPRRLSLETSQRSSVASGIREAIQRASDVFELAGAEVRARDPYPGWQPNLDSPLLKIARDTWKEISGSDAEVRAIHAGLECGILGERYPGMDMVSLGPNLHDLHSPDERIEIASVERTWTYLLAILRNVARRGVPSSRA